jgi:hypothetical protein
VLKRMGNMPIRRVVLCAIFLRGGGEKSAEARLPPSPRLLSHPVIEIPRKFRACSSARRVLTCVEARLATRPFAA